MSDEDLIIASAAFIVIHSLLDKKRRRRKRRWWMTSRFKSRNKYSESDLRKESLHVNNTFYSMSSADFDNLINLVGPIVMKEDTKFRKAIPVKERLAVTLRYLTSGDSYSSLSVLFKISKQSISNIVPHVCSAIIESLKEYIKKPETQNQWVHIAEGYENKWNFPHCIGGMDGKQIVLHPPMNTDSEFVLFALVDADYSFIYADVGYQGRISDGSIFRNMSLFKQLRNNTLQLPDDEALPGRKKLVPYVFVADVAFPLHQHIIKPYSGKQRKGSKEMTFNHKTNGVCKIVENVFGILSAVFRVLRKPILLQPERAHLIVLVCIYLHNYLRKSSTSRDIYSPDAGFDYQQDGKEISGSWRQDKDPLVSLLPLQNVAWKLSQNCEEIRDEFAKYFATNGKVI